MAHVAIYKCGWTKFTCPVCNDPNQLVPAGARTPRMQAMLADVASAQYAGEMRTCSACSAELDVRIDPKTCFQPRTPTPP